MRFHLFLDPFYILAVNLSSETAPIFDLSPPYPLFSGSITFVVLVPFLIPRLGFFYTFYHTLILTFRSGLYYSNHLHRRSFLPLFVLPCSPDCIPFVSLIHGLRPSLRITCVITPVLYIAV